MKKQTILGLLTLLGFSTLFALAGGSNDFGFVQFGVETTPSGQVSRLEFNTETNRLYSILRTPDLVSNDWNVVEDQLPGTGTNMVYIDLTPLSSLAWFYKATSTSALPVNLVQNSGFELPALASGGTNINASSDWVQNGGNQVIQKASWATETGEQGAWLQAWNANLNQSFHQEIPGIAGAKYTLEAAFKFNANFESNGSTLEMAMVWLDNGGAEISRLTLDVNAHLDSSEGWKHLDIAGMAPAGTATIRAWFHWTTDGNIETPSNASALIDNVSLLTSPLGTSVETINWTSFGNATHVAAAQYAGLYALANETSIQINRIDQSPVDSVSIDTINGMAFTASGRQLFVSTPTAVKAYNTGTGELRDFATGLSLGTNKLGIAHFKGELFVGTPSGEIRRYRAQLADATGTYLDSVNLGEPVRGIVADIQDKMLYVAAPNHLYRLDPDSSALTQIASISGIEAIGFGRTYGAAGQGGLIILQDTGTERLLHLVPTADLHAGGSVTPMAYYRTTRIMPDIAATADGRLLAAGITPKMLSDSDDTRMDFMEWVADEFTQNVLMAKSLCWQDGGLTGMVQNSATRLGKNRKTVASPDAAFWVVNQLLMSDEVNGDPEAQAMVRKILKRHATLEVNTDGQWYHWYDSNTGQLTWGDPDYTTSIFSTMKGVHMAIRAKAYYPNDPEIVAAANTIVHRLRNQRDYIRDFGNQASPANDGGPLIGADTFSPYIETHLFSELMAASEPMCENAYLDYWRYRGNHTYDYTLPGEPIVRKNASGFWRMYDQATIQFCRDDAEWSQEFKNFYALFAGWTDDNAPEHLTAFSAGSNPDGYNADKFTNHPWTVNSFGTIIGFGLQGNTIPVVGAYFAYRDGRRQSMAGAANYAGASLLTRISYDDPGWRMDAISPTDHQYAGYALGEILAPGSIENTIALHTYLEPQFDGTTLRFSRTAKRQVWGTTNGTDWVSLGFHTSPYTPPAGLPYTDYTATGAEGELLVPTSSQDYDVTADFDNTLYIVRAVSTNSGPLRVRWYNGSTFLSEQTGFQTLDALKPAGATLLRADLSGDSFEQISVVLDGAEDPFDNSGFENGNFSGWVSWAGLGMSKAVVADSRLEGAYACELTATQGASDRAGCGIFREFDISGDPTNTHYVLEFDALTENLQGSSIRTTLVVYNGEGGTIRTEYFDSYEHANSQTRLSAGIRKRDADHEKIRFKIFLHRDNASAVTADDTEWPLRYRKD